ncbi:MAG: MerR family DNA-binding transcriptional regulator [Candidatus Gracilibacteria bacterium]|jgi:excisionase family DNA binding protein
MGEKLLTISEAAKMLGVSIDTLRRWDKKGTLASLRGSASGYRYYLEGDLLFFWNDLFKMAEDWVLKETGSEPHSDLYCQTNDVFQNRLIKLQNSLSCLTNLAVPFSLIVALIGEVGNNSFDHNLGSWRDIPGIFFGYNLEKKYIVLADRGQGILTTLKRVKPSLTTYAEAMQTAFTEVLSGRAPETRGNGLKFVKNIVIENQLKFFFESGDAKLSLEHGDTSLDIAEKIPLVHGCVAMLQF